MTQHAAAPAQPVTAPPTPLGANVYNDFTGNSGITQIIAPGANANGVILRTIALYGSNNNAVLFAGNSAPTAWNDTTKKVVAKTFSTGDQATLKDIKLQAGDGLWMARNSAGSYIGITFDIL